MHIRTSLLLAVIATTARAEPLTFAGALDLAARSAPGVQAKALQVEATRSAARAAGALPDPKLAVGIDNFPVSGPPAGRFDADDMTMARIGVTQDIPNTARRRAATAGAGAEVDLAQAEAEAASRDVRIATALAWLDLAYAEKRIAALDQLTAGLKGLWDGQPASVASGAARPAAGLAPARLRAEFEDRRSALVAEAAKARADLARWTGDPSPSVAGQMPTFEIDASDLRAGLDGLPALAQRQAATRRAEAAADAARASKQPDWGVEVAYGRRDPMFGDMVSAGVTVSLPLFARGRQDPLIAARTAEVGRARLEREDARRALAAALERDLADHEMHHQQWRRSVDVLVPTAEQQSHLEVSSYGAGRADFNDVMDALTGLADAKLEALEREAMVARDGVRIVLTYGSAQ
ncbi:MAG: TolC family protein [Phenylobacterium sp.]|uniref:TolC family protein n=1 Tax=Phenylobacterium sp. TaxID=1871053 RepID=UPI001A1DF44D|nr:TolC family protein [Phenylobacterium sp.]MBJ7412221.1 TolC family protein [Phenylobacterium sp.]